MAWDGITVTVLWEQRSDGAALSAGHVVAVILAEVLDKVNCELRIQNCGPGCHYNFIHAAAALVDDPTVEDYKISAGSSRVVQLASDWYGSPIDIVRHAHFCLSGDLETFSSFSLGSECRISKTTVGYICLSC